MTWRNCRLLLTLLKMRLARTMAFRFNFFGAFFVDGSLFLLQLAMFEAIYSQVDSIAGWGRGEMLVFVGTFSMINALNMTLFFFGIYEIPRKIREGELDHYLTKPIDPLLRLTFENIDLGSAPLIAASALIVVHGASTLDTAVSYGTVIGYVIMVLLMTLLWYDVMLILRTVSFFFLSASAATQLEENFLPMNMKIPGVVYRGVFKAVFYLILPYGIMATFPTQLLAGTLSAGGLFYGIGVVALFTAFMLRFWRCGLCSYQSASS